MEKDGYQVVMTREEDKGLYQEGSSNKKAQDMQNRCALIAEEKPAVSVSIHQNSYSDPEVKGPQVFYYEHSAQGEELAVCIQEQPKPAIGGGTAQTGKRKFYLLSAETQ